MIDKIKKDILDSVAVKQSLVETMPPVIQKAAEMMYRCVKEGNKILFFGNGGSASDSQHLAAEFVGRYERERRGLAAIALTTDTSILTAVGNDYGYDTVFRRQVEALGRKGDVAVGISTSGNSPNVLLGLQKAKELGLHTISFTGRDGGKMKGLADVSINIPVQKTSRIQECHIMIGHILCERIDELFLD